MSRDDNELRLMLDPTMAAPELARRAVAQWQSGLGLDDRLNGDVLTVVSELVTNAVCHAHSPSEVIATIDDDVLRLEVHDLGTAPPVLRPHDGASSGHGLRFVAELTDRWGWRPTTTGKYVWTETDFGDRGRRAP